MPSACIARRSSGWAAPGCVPSSPGRSCFTASGCAARIAAATARVQLRAAHDHFTSIGMEAFAERARGELLATGEKVRKRTVETRDDLTAQERLIAGLARDGLTNPEIGARLFLSPRDGRVASTQGVHQAWDPLAPGPDARAVELRVRLIRTANSADASRYCVSVTHA